MATAKEVLLDLKVLVALQTTLNSDIDLLQSQWQQKREELGNVSRQIELVRASLEAEVDKLAIDAR